MEKGSNKYAPLGSFLAARPPEAATVTLTPAQVQALIGGCLPAGASARGFWADTRADARGTPQARAWREAGWYVAAVHLSVGVAAVTFARRPAAAPP